MAGKGWRQLLQRWIVLWARAQLQSRDGSLACQQHVFPASPGRAHVARKTKAQVVKTSARPKCCTPPCTDAGQQSGSSSDTT